MPFATEEPLGIRIRRKFEKFLRCSFDNNINIQFPDLKPNRKNVFVHSLKIMKNFSSRFFSNYVS